MLVCVSFHCVGVLATLGAKWRSGNETKKDSGSSDANVQLIAVPRCSTGSNVHLLRYGRRLRYLVMAEKRLFPFMAHPNWALTVTAAELLLSRALFSLSLSLLNFQDIRSLSSYLFSLFSFFGSLPFPRTAPTSKPYTVAVATRGLRSEVNPLSFSRWL